MTRVNIKAWRERDPGTPNTDDSTFYSKTRHRSPFMTQQRSSMDGLSLTAVSAEQVASLLTTAPLRGYLVVDLRPNSQFSSGHIRGAENLNFSNILLRRLLKGVVKLEAMLTSPALIERVCRGRHTTQLILCDSGSSTASRRPELLKHAEVFVNCLRDRDAKEGLQHGYSLQYVDGGYPAFSSQFSELCEQSSSSSSSSSHVHISVSASLPISLHSNHKPKLKLQSAPADDSDRYGPPVEILPHLILGCAKDSSDLLALQRLGVTAVLNVSHNCPSLFPSQLQYMEIRVPDTYQADILSRLDEAFAFIDGVQENGGRVLVHCHAGVSRSATVCMAYVMKTLDYDLRSAYDYVKTKRSCVSPNLHFMGQLLEFEKRIRNSVASSCEVDGFSHTLMCVEEEQEEEKERPCSLPPSWVSREKRRAVSTPASLGLCILSTPTHKATLSCSPTPPANSSSLPCTPLCGLAGSHPSPTLCRAHSPHSCSLQSLAHSPMTVTPQHLPLPHRQVTESL